MKGNMNTALPCHSPSPWLAARSFDQHAAPQATRRSRQKDLETETLNPEDSPVFDFSVSKSFCQHFLPPNFKFVFSAFMASLRLIALVCAVALGTVGSTAYGRINVTTLPGRDSVQLTVYNSADLTMVKETRTLVFRKGLNHLEFRGPTRLLTRPRSSFGR